jgi:hypothetical protein
LRGSWKGSTEGRLARLEAKERVSADG